MLKSKEIWNRIEEIASTPCFQAKIMGSNLGNSYAFRMYWLDNTHDTRHGAFVGYALLLPNDRISQVAPHIAENPELLIKSFQSVFPQYDNSKGTLKVNETNGSVIVKDL